MNTDEQIALIRYAIVCYAVRVRNLQALPSLTQAEIREVNELRLRLNQLNRDCDKLINQP